MLKSEQRSKNKNNSNSGGENKIRTDSISSLHTKKSNNTDFNSIINQNEKDLKTVKENLSPNIMASYNEHNNNANNANKHGTSRSHPKTYFSSSNSSYNNLQHNYGGYNRYSHKPAIKTNQPKSMSEVANTPTTNNNTNNENSNITQQQQSKKGRCNSAYTLKKLNPTAVTNSSIQEKIERRSNYNSSTKYQSGSIYPNSSSILNTNKYNHSQLSSQRNPTKIKKTSTNINFNGTHKPHTNNITASATSTLQQNKEKLKKEPETVNHIINHMDPIKTHSQIFSTVSEASPKFSTILNDKNSDFNSTAGQGIVPFTINCLRDTKLNIKHGIIEVLPKQGDFDPDEKEKILKFQLKDKNLMIIIKEDGKLIEIKKTSNSNANTIKDSDSTCTNIDKSYPIEKLPYKYYSFYNYARKVVDLLKSKIPKVKLKNIYGTFILMENSPNPNYEALFTNGIKITTKCGTNMIT